MNIGTIEHHKHGLYYIFYKNGLYGINKENKTIHCAYASLSEMFKLKGL